MTIAKFYQFVTERATETQPSWTNKDCIRFHYFNPNGVYAQKKATDKLIDALVDEGKAKGGAIIAYGSLNYHNTEHLAAMLRYKRVKPSELYAVISGIQWDIEKAKKLLQADPDGLGMKLREVKLSVRHMHTCPQLCEVTMLLSCTDNC